MEEMLGIRPGASGISMLHAFSSLTSARDYAEYLRVQGSAFYISEMPALVLEANALALAVTQINCEDVLAGYSPTQYLTTSDMVAHRLQISETTICVGEAL
jgi:hypothetical protein